MGKRERGREGGKGGKEKRKSVKERQRKRGKRKGMEEPDHHQCSLRKVGKVVVSRDGIASDCTFINRADLDCSKQLNGNVCEGD